MSNKIIVFLLPLLFAVLSVTAFGDPLFDLRAAGVTVVVGAIFESAIVLGNSAT